MRDEVPDDQARIFIEAALRRVLAEVAIGDYRDPLGHRMTLNPAYTDAVSILELTDLLGSECKA